MADKPFTTSTEPPKKSVVDDKLKPTAEMHVLTGGPYKDASGEEHRYGHTALRIKTAKSDKTYDFGRYGDVSGMFGESGDGILRVWTSFAPYIKGENALNRKTVGFVYPIFEHQADQVNHYFDTLTSAGKELKGRSNSSRKVYKLVQRYHALGPNCTTLSIDGARVAISNIDSGSEKFNKPEEVLTFPERLALKAKGGAPRLFLPANLETFLRHGSSVKPSRIESYGAGK
jgi:hypothetical protein